MRFQKSTLLATLIFAVLAVAPAAHSAPPPPEIRVVVPDSVEPGGSVVVEPFVFNNTDQRLAGPITITETVSPGGQLTEPNFFESFSGNAKAPPSSVTARHAEQIGQTWTYTLTVEPPGIRSGVLLRSTPGAEGQLLNVDPNASGSIALDIRVTSGNAPIAEAHEMVRVGEPGTFQFDWKGVLRKPDHSAFAEAGAVPDSFVTDLSPTTFATKAFKFTPVTAVAEQLKDVLVHLPPGFIGNPQAIPTCPYALLQQHDGNTPQCPRDSQVGLVKLSFGGFAGKSMLTPALFNLEPSPGSPARFGFEVFGVPVVLIAHLNQDDYGIDVVSVKTSTTLALTGAEVEIYGVPTDVSHDGVGARCLENGNVNANGYECPSTLPRTAFLRAPTSCGGPLEVSLEANTYQNPEFMHRERFELPALKACDRLPFQPDLSVQATSLQASSPTGLHATLKTPNTGLDNPGSVSESDIKSVKVTLPKGMSINPSQAEGLGACSEAAYESSELSFHPDGTKGCPSDSKIGTVEVHTPLLEETIPGNVYVAKPYDNPFDSLLALYVVLEEPERGILVKVAGKVDLDPRTGQITTTFDELPQQPFSEFDFKFREGVRAPLVTPQSCGTYATTTEFTPWANPNQVRTTTSSFQVTSGIGGGPCPSGGLPPFRPGLNAGTLNNRAGSYSPFNLRLFRTDSEQEFTNFSIKLPPGVIGKIAGLGYCSDAAIALAKSREGRPDGGQEELDHPSCPASSQVGRTLVGAGVGSVLTYAPGKLYYAGPYNGSAISLVSITAAKVGPFDLGTVVIRFAVRVNPETGEIFIDPTGSDPIPHIISGVTTHLRDIRAYNDRPDFTLNPTSCERTSTASTLLGSGLDFFSDADDRPITVSSPFQAADCAVLGFKPKLSLSLQGGTKRAGHPALRAVYQGRPGDANLARAQATLPKSEFLDQSHIGTVCTRVQFNQGKVLGEKCPPRSIYGYARATTPLLDGPLAGPVFLRSSEHKLPDLVAALHAPQFDIAVVGRIDSLDGRIRTTFESVPDAPVSKFVLSMRGGKKGLLENSTNLCRGAHRAIVAFDAHNGKSLGLRPELEPECGKHKRRHHQPKGPTSPQPSPYRVR